MKNLRWLDHVTCARLLGLSPTALDELANNAEGAYREVPIQDGDKTRPLHIPRQDLKKAQRRLHRRVFRLIEPHPAAYAVRGKGVVAAARRHAHHPWFFHTDLKNFYPSVDPGVVSDTFKKLGTPNKTIQVLTKLVTVDGQLPQGAPTSPGVGELVLNPLDRRLAGLLGPQGLTYTRYADDVTVSGGKKLNTRIIHLIQTFIADEGWEVNDKGGLFGPKESHQMLGLVVNGDPTTSPGYAERLRHFLRLVRKEGAGLDAKVAEKVAGRIEWVRATNPERADRLQRLLRASTSLASEPPRVHRRLVSLSLAGSVGAASGL